MTNNSLIPDVGNTKLTSRLRQAIALMVVIFLGIIISLITQA